MVLQTPKLPMPAAPHGLPALPTIPAIQGLHGAGVPAQHAEHAPGLHHEDIGLHEGHDDFVAPDGGMGHRVVGQPPGVVDMQHPAHTTDPGGMSAQQEAEQRLWRTWHDSGKTPETRDPKILEQILQSLQAPIQQQIRQYKNRVRVPPDAIEAASRRLAIESLSSYDPKRGARLATHVINGQRRIQRYVQERANISRITESRVNRIGDYERAMSQLEDELGYPPSEAEVAKKLKMSVRNVQNLRQENRKDFIASSSPVPDPFIDETPEHREILQLLPASLTADQLRVFEFTQGINGKPKITSTGDIARKLGWSDAKVVGVRTAIAGIIAKYLS